MVKLKAGKEIIEVVFLRESFWRGGEKGENNENLMIKGFAKCHISVIQDFSGFSKCLGVKSNKNRKREATPFFNLSYKMKRERWFQMLLIFNIFRQSFDKI